MSRAETVFRLFLQLVFFFALLRAPSFYARRHEARQEKRLRLSLSTAEATRTQKKKKAMEKFFFFFFVVTAKKVLLHFFFFFISSPSSLLSLFPPPPPSSSHPRRAIARPPPLDLGTPAPPDLRLQPPADALEELGKVQAGILLLFSFFFF